MSASRYAIQHRPDKEPNEHPRQSQIATTTRRQRRRPRLRSYGYEPDQAWHRERNTGIRKPGRFCNSKSRCASARRVHPGTRVPEHARPSRRILWNRPAHSCRSRDPHEWRPPTQIRCGLATRRSASSHPNPGMPGKERVQDRKEKILVHSQMHPRSCPPIWLAPRTRPKDERALPSVPVWNQPHRPY